MSGKRGHLRLTAYPPGGPYNHWELVVEETGEVLLEGATFPIPSEIINAASRAYHARFEVNGSSHA